MDLIFQKKLKILLNERQCSVNDITSETGISKSTIYRWFNAKTKTTPTFDNLKALAVYFDVDTSFFFTENNSILLEKRILALEERVKILEKIKQ